MDDAHRRPDGVDDATVRAVAQVTEALDWIERARGRLYDFHQLVGRADFVLGDAADALTAAGHEPLAALLRSEIVGRNVLDGRWTYQVIEEFEEGYYDAFRAAEARVRDELVGGRRHLYEAELKEQRRSRGRAHHEGEPPAR